MALQQAIDSALIEFFTNISLHMSASDSVSASNSSDIRHIQMRLQRFPYPPYVADNFVLVIQQQLPFIVMLSFIFCAIQIVRDLVYEKECRLKVFVNDSFRFWVLDFLLITAHFFGAVLG